MRLVMVIDERDGAGDFAGVGFLAILDELRRIMSAMASERLSQPFRASSHPVVRAAQTATKH